MCYTEKAPNAWHRRGTQKTGNTYNQPKRLSTDITHRPSTWHYRKGSPGVKTHNTNQHSSRARLQHSNHPTSLPTPNWVINRSAQPTQRAEPHYTTDTTRLSGDTQRPSRLGGPHQEWPADSPGRPSCFWGRAEGGVRGVGGDERRGGRAKARERGG